MLKKPLGYPRPQRKQLTKPNLMQIIGVLNKTKTSKPNLSVPETKALGELRCDNSLMILPADKGRAMVVINNSGYDTKVKTMLADESTHKPLCKDSPPSPTSMTNKSNSLTESQYNQLRCSAGHTPLLYALQRSTNQIYH